MLSPKVCQVNASILLLILLFMDLFLSYTDMLSPRLCQAKASVLILKERWRLKDCNVGIYCIMCFMKLGRAVKEGIVTVKTTALYLGSRL